MIDPTLYLAFIAAVTAFILIPGPNVALIVTNSLEHGPRHGLMTVAGTSLAMVPQLAAVCLGLTGLMQVVGSWFEWLRWLGVAYLIYLGVRQWMAPAVDLAVTAPRILPYRTVFLRGLIVSSTNPKTLLFYGAFFPQFVARDLPVGPQVVVLALTFLGLAMLLDGLWAVTAAQARRFVQLRGQLRNRISGGILVGAGLGLALFRNR